MRARSDGDETKVKTFPSPSWTIVAWLHFARSDGTIRRSLAAIPVLAVALLLKAAVPALGQSCAAIRQDVRRLMVVIAPNMDTSIAMTQLFERESERAAWHAIHIPEPAVLGRSGLAWGASFRNVGLDGEPLKTEGDMRTPAGIYPIGSPFGFDSSSRRDYLQLKSETLCIDDPSSSAYNMITTRTVVGSRAHAENMRRISLYRRGLVINYPTDALAKAGSCIFIHVWRAANRGTAGCVALPERRVAALQDFAEGGAAIAILPETALRRFGDCLPNVTRKPKLKNSDTGLHRDLEGPQTDD